MCSSHRQDHRGEAATRSAQQSCAAAPTWYRTPIGRLCLSLSAVALAYLAYVLWSGHRAHVVEFLPFLVLLLCPLMHVFLHRGRHGGGDDSESGPE